MHRKVLPLSALDALDTGITPPTDPEQLKLFNESVEKLGNQFGVRAIRDIVIAIPPNSNVLELRAGHFALYVARHFNEPVVLVRVKYDSAKTGGPFWIAAPEDWYA
jgi:hypothetical protein